MDSYNSSQTQPNAQDQERSPTSTEIHSVLVMPAPDLGGQLSPLLMPHTQAHAPLKPGFWKGTPGSFPCIPPDTTWFQPPLCWQVPPLLQRRLVHTAWHWVEDRTTSQQISTANQRWRKAHQNQGPALAVSGSGPAGTSKRAILYSNTHKSTINSLAVSSSHGQVRV